MKSSRSVAGALALVGLGAAAVVAATHVRISFGPAAQASPVVLAETKPALPPPSAAQVNDARQFSRTFAQVAAQLSPSVVRISITKSAKGVHFNHRGGPQGGNPFEGTPWERFFGEPDEGEGGPGMRGPKQHGTGSGVLVDAKGYVLTNNHVVEDADEVKVTFVDGKTVTGRVVGTDPKSDLAVVKVDGVDVKPARLGDSDKAQVGEWVMAIGNPFGFDHTVTVGVLSAKSRSVLGNGNFEDFLQTDASINPGNSGGPLINLDGEVIGINTMIAGIGTGIGFAVPSSMAKPIVDQLIHNGKVRRPYLGILMQQYTPEVQKSFGAKAPPKGALVSEVQSGTPADKAGVKPGDVIVNVDGTAVDDSKAVQKTVLNHKIGQKIDLTVWRDGQTMKISPTTAELPSDDKTIAQRGEPGSPKARLGIELRDLTPDLAQRIGVEKGAHGAVVTSVREGSPAQEAGVQQGDVLIEIDRRPVSGAPDALHALGAERAGGHLLRIRRGEHSLFIVVPTA